MGRRTDAAHGGHRERASDRRARLQGDCRATQEVLVKEIVLHSEARRELDDAMDYYEQACAGLGQEFLVETEKGLDRIQQNPKQGTLYKNTGHRRFVVRRFPYNVFYIELPDRIRITAIAHA